MVPIDHEIDITDLVHRDRRESKRRKGSLETFPALPCLGRSREEITVEVVGPVDSSDDLVDIDRLKPGVGLSEQVKTGAHVVEGRKGRRRGTANHTSKTAMHLLAVSP
jgi:hypothetical protein